MISLSTAPPRPAQHSHRPGSVLILVPLLALTIGCGEVTDPSAIPIIEGVNPPYQAVGDPEARIIVWGQAFEGESVIRWNGQALSTTNWSSRWPGHVSISASVPVSELDHPKDVVITVHTPRQGGGGISSAPWPYRVEYPSPGHCWILLPYFAGAGDPATLFRCRGWGFLPVTEVYLDDVLVPSEHVDGRNLRFTAPAELLAEPRTRRIRIRSPGLEGWGWTVGSSLHVLQPVEVGRGGRQIGAGCIIDAYGLLQCWDSIPRPVVPHLRFRELRSGHYGNNSCALTVSGEVYCWGFNSYGQLGTGTFEDLAPTTAPSLPVAGGLALRELAMGDSFVCGLDSEGGAWCWGANDYGQLGTLEELATCSADVPCAPQPTPVAGGLRFKGIAAGGTHTCAIDAAGVAYCWGNDDRGQLGNGPGRNDSRVPQPVDSEVRFASITARSYTTCALTEEGAAYCWGGRTELNPPSWEAPTPVAEALRFASLTDGSCGITSQGEIYCFYPIHDPSSPVVRMGEEHAWTEIRIGPHTFSICGFTTDHGFLCWGGWWDPSHIEFPLVRGPAVCGYADRHQAHPMYCYPSSTAVFGVAGQALWPEQ